MYDITIIGAGPAGITAAIYSARKKLKTLILTKTIGGQAALSSDIENYTGYQFITGVDLAKNFENHLKSFDNIDLKENTEVDCVEQINETFKIKTKDAEYESKTLIIASGRKPKMLGIPGEANYKNKGVTYCATCDAPLFSGKDVAVIGGGNSALDAALQLINIANKIYVINVHEEFKGDQVMIDKVNKSEKTEVLNKTITKEIKGDKFVNSIIINQNNEDKELKVQGVFVEIGSLPVSGPACDNLKLNDNNEIIVNEKCETGAKGIFAAGDVTNIPEKQIIVAAGQGCIAALSAFKYLSKTDIASDY